MRFRLAIILCKLIRFVLRKLGRGGTALPGRVALRICPDLLRRLARGVKTVVITGTNGKTTSARIVETALAASGASYFANRSGANLITGITTEYADNATLRGRPKREYAVIECDEAASKSVFAQIDPAVVLVTNVFPDQLDRYGDVAATVENIKTGVLGAPNATVCLNADDPLTASIARSIKNRTAFFGIETDLTGGESYDAPRCIICGGKLEYSLVTYDHLGRYSCPECGYSRPEADISVAEVLESAGDYTRVRIERGNESHDMTINLPGAYNIYNAAGAVAAVTALGLDIETALEATATFECGFGRMEKFTLGSAPARMILVKNPAGLNQVINFVSSQAGDAVLAIALSNQVSDGVDTSWIWDTRIEQLAEMYGALKRVLLTGPCADELALRFKYAGLDNFEVIREYGELFSRISSQDEMVYIIPTYTAMMELRGIISKDFGYGNFWE